MCADGFFRFLWKKSREVPMMVMAVRALSYLCRINRASVIGNIYTWLKSSSESDERLAFLLCVKCVFSLLFMLSCLRFLFFISFFKRSAFGLMAHLWYVLSICFLCHCFLLLLIIYFYFFSLNFFLYF